MLTNRQKQILAFLKEDEYVTTSYIARELDLSDKTSNWRVSDFISEGWYQSEQIDSENNHRAFAMWRRVALIGNQILTDDMTCVEEHMSKYDKLG